MNIVSPKLFAMLIHLAPEAVYLIDPCCGKRFDQAPCDCAVHLARHIEATRDLIEFPWPYPEPIYSHEFDGFPFFGNAHPEEKPS
jgi:hypothetical protein